MARSSRDRKNPGTAPPVDRTDRHDGSAPPNEPPAFPSSRRRRRDRAGRRAGRSPSRASGSSASRSEEHTSELQSQSNLVCRLLLEKKKMINVNTSLIFRHHFLKQHSLPASVFNHLVTRASYRQSARS